MKNEELIKALRAFDVCESCPCEYPKMCEDADCIVIQAANALEAAEKRIAELEAQTPKHGEWIEKEVFEKPRIPEWQTCRCSVCGRYETIPYMYYFRESKYCSECGARMDGKEKEDE